MLVVDAKNMIFGRLASQIAKKLLMGEEIQLVNAEQIVIKGNPHQIIERYITKRKLQHKGTPERSPKWPKLPHLFVKRLIRGMLPRTKSRGKEALKRLMVYTGNPKNLPETIKIEKATFDGLSKHTTILDICKQIGYVN